ncbi:MAG: glycosyltransferase [Planctomycetes bacterium]|nr:glycosyltransferase [Planctomycetota bacterium]
MKTTTESLSVFLLVRNAQARLACEVERLLETAAELTTRFEVVIIDDGSTDATEEIAWELSARHAQVELIRQPKPLGPVVALRAGLAFTSGQWLLVSDGTGVASDEALSALWRQRHGEGQLYNPAASADSGWVQRLLRPLRGQAAAAIQPACAKGWRLLRRAELADLAPTAAGTGRSYLDRPRTPRAPLTTPTADNRSAAWHNATV